MNPKYQKVLSDIEKAEKKKSEIEGQLGIKTGKMRKSYPQGA